MPYKPTEPSMNLGKFAVKLAKEVSLGTLEGVRNLLSDSFRWSSKTLSAISDAPMISETKLADFLQKTGNSLSETGAKTKEGLTKALEATENAMHIAIQAMEKADTVVKHTLFENIPVSSIVGESFAGLVTTSTIQPSFRENGKDITAEEMVQNWKKSKLKRLILCVPGLFCDEGLWNSHGEIPLSATFKELGMYPVYVRFNPGAPIPTNGKALFALLKELFRAKELDGKQIEVIAFSQGGLVLRSALYYSNIENQPLSKKIRKALIISAPDGGSYIEKIGFWLGLGAEHLPVLPISLIGFIGNQRSEAMKDLSHGIIRDEDREAVSQVDRYSSDLYFGELDDVDAYQLYSLVSPDKTKWSSWIGDGIVETPSLESLSERVFRKKPKPETRVRCLFGLSHYQIMTAEDTKKMVRDVFD
ncbi:hypothetical protein CH373_05370 [Leptospira perolatii]|uniref:DUF676 domain-containing protein n=2 Tax=Leptospira perolatii TaxID=2023191 RepID=A0A2M9ZQH3_9LEPT|nr:hypothetical protein [Leptospira perolatii]PJZ70501.1 hypothetical protein CH360_05790 [Leptospira perolatii]PJZ74337.1 hypothetical protein CH373_05370 [Leptospira perolatii]